MSNDDVINLVITKSGERKHTHPSDVVHIAVRKAITNLKIRARDTPNEMPINIVREVINNIRNKKVLVMLPDRNCLRTINNVQNRERPHVPVNFIDLEIVNPYRTTLDGKAFMMLFDSGRNNPDRIIILSTIHNLNDLYQSEIMVGDGTFKTVPQQLLQLYTMIIKLEEKL